MNYKITKAYKKSPLLVFVICAVLLGSGVGAVMYWFSEPLTYDLVVQGQIVATTNFNTGALDEVNSYEDLVAISKPLIYVTDSKYMIRVAAKGGNPSDVYTSLKVTLPGTSTCTAQANRGVWIYGVASGVAESTPIATDGTESVQVIHSGNALWFLESEYSTGTVNILYFALDIDWDLSLPIGTHQVTAFVELGDSL